MYEYLHLLRNHANIYNKKEMAFQIHNTRTCTTKFSDRIYAHTRMIHVFSSDIANGNLITPAKCWVYMYCFINEIRPMSLTLHIET